MTIFLCWICIKRKWQYSYVEIGIIGSCYNLMVGSLSLIFFVFCVMLFVLFVFVLCLVCPMSPVFLDCHFFLQSGTWKWQYSCVEIGIIGVEIFLYWGRYHKKWQCSCVVACIQYRMKYQFSHGKVIVISSINILIHKYNLEKNPSAMIKSWCYLGIILFLVSSNFG